MEVFKLYQKSGEHNSLERPVIVVAENLKQALDNVSTRLRFPVVQVEWIGTVENPNAQD